VVIARFWSPLAKSSLARVIASSATTPSLVAVSRVMVAMSKNVTAANATPSLEPESRL
jgi:hypothetical protein